MKAFALQTPSRILPSKKKHLHYSQLVREEIKLSKQVYVRVLLDLSLAARFPSYSTNNFLNLNWARTSVLSGDDDETNKHAVP